MNMPAVSARPALRLLFAVILLGGVARAGEPVPASATAGPAPAAVTASAGVEVRFFAMGQADAMLVTGPTATVLVDCGAPNDAAKDAYKRVLDELRRRNSQHPRLDALIVTHFHSDHVGEDADHDTPRPSGIFALFAEGVTVTSLIDHGDKYADYAEETRPHKQWVAALPGWKAKGVFAERRVPQTGERIALGGGATIEFVAVNGNGVIERAAKTGRFEDNASPSENDYSISFVLRSGDFELFSGGDLSGEDTAVRVGRSGRKRKRRSDIYNDVETVVAPVVGNVEVLRANHHGSPHSTNATFAKALRPEASIISCGHNNPYHHPSPDVVGRLAPFGPVLATSGLAADWKDRPDAPRVCGDITLSVSPGGATYLLRGAKGEIWRGRSYSDADEARDLDHPELAPPKPPVEAPPAPTPTPPVPAGTIATPGS